MPASETAASDRQSTRYQESHAQEPDPELLKSLPWHDIARIADIIFAHLPEAEVKRLNKILWARYGA